MDREKILNCVRMAMDSVCGSANAVSRLTDEELLSLLAVSGVLRKMALNEIDSRGYQALAKTQLTQKEELS